MKRIYMSIAIITLTVITVFCIFFAINTIESTADFKNDSLVLNGDSKNINDIEEGACTTEFLKKNKKYTKNKDEVKENISEKNKNNNENYRKSEENKKKLRESEAKKEDAKVKKDETAISVFKVEKNTLKDKIPLTDKGKLLYISRKLSIEDYGKIKKYMESPKELESAKEIFIILKDKLSNEDYKRIKEIMASYVKIDLIEDAIKQQK